MLDLLLRLEYRRRALRIRVLGCYTDVDQSFFGLAALIFFAYLPTILVPPAAAATAPPESVAVGALILIGAILCATVIATPIGLVFF